jgi:hypothetical protein
MKSTKSDYSRLKNQLKKVDYFGQKNKLNRPALLFTFHNLLLTLNFFDIYNAEFNAAGTNQSAAALMNEQHIFMIRFVCVCSNLGGARRARRI